MANDVHAPEVRRSRIEVEGTVQGVGFRPFVHGLASELSVGGFVRNDATGVLIEVEGDHGAVTDFVTRLAAEAPPLALIDRIDTRSLVPRGETDFAILASDHGKPGHTLVSPDVATCADCLGDLTDPSNRRYRHPFVNCTNCGPRYSIVETVPYDRGSTTMAGFAMCPTCRREYHDPSDRRFHAQPVCCPDCGPRLELRDHSGRVETEDPIRSTADLLRAGRTVAVKGLGGFHLAVAAWDEGAAATLRARKHREDKPFAVMVADLAAARRLCVLDDEAAALLTGPASPIVLAERRHDAGVAPSVAPGNRRLGVMLPPTPLHHRLAAELAGPFVLTSGNVSDEPICFVDEQAIERLSGIADAFLLHDRGIHMRVDDSVTHVVAGRSGLLRRSRGFAPAPVPLPDALPRDVLGVGAELKSTVCLGAGHQALLSHHLGDLANYETFDAFVQAIAHLRRLFDVHPEIVAHDLHPEYLSTKHATEMEDVELLGVQHHHAHIASCLADNGEVGPVIGLALDGLGMGTDGTVWGGELLIADLRDYERAGHLETVPMPGGERAIREPWRMAASHLAAAFDGSPPGHLDVVRRNEERLDDVLAIARAGMNSPSTSSAGRLFDAVAALLGVRDTITYEGQAAIELEQLADPTETGTYPVTLADDAPLRLPVGELIRAVVADLDAEVAIPRIAGRFHNAVARMLGSACVRMREVTGLSRVALSGGVFQNALLVERTLPVLEEAGFTVLTHRRVPPNDGGISLGQVAVAGARLRAGCG